MKLRAKLLALLAPFVVLPMLALGWISYDQLKRTVQDNSAAQLESMVRDADRRMRTRLASDQANVVLLSTLAVVERYLLVDDEATRYELLQPSLLSAFAAYQKAWKNYYEIRLIGPDGFEDTRSVLDDLPNRHEQEGHSAWFRDIRTARKDIQSRVAYNADTGELALFVSRRVRLRDPQASPASAPELLRGYVVITSGLDFLTDPVDVYADPSGSRLMLVDAGGRIVSDRANLLQGSPLPAEVVAAVPPLAVSPISLKFEHAGHAMRAVGLRIHENLYAFAALPEAQLDVQTHRLGRTVGAITFCTIVVISTLLYVALRRLLLNPMGALGHAARQLGRGNRVASLDLDRADEFGELARSFEEMRMNLEGSNEQVRHMAYHDSLTELPNRRLFMELLAAAAEQAGRDGGSLALLFLDLDDFKHVNDSLGHDAGDELLTELARRLRHCLRECDVFCRAGSGSDEGNPDTLAQHTLARVGGDEFIVLLNGIGRPSDAAIVARRMMGELQRSFDLAGQQVHISTSIGITLFPEDGRDVGQLVKNADLAMYHAKSLGKNTHQFFSARMNAQANQRMRTEAALRRAIECGEFVLHYQPKVDASTGVLRGVEALIRWNNPQLGMVPPSDFIPIAEDTGLIVPIGEWVLQEACRQLQAWRVKGLPVPSVSVNISNRQFARPGLEDMVSAVLARSYLAPHCLELEITETCVMEPAEVAAATLAKIKELGVFISMDDFGTGYSSLAALRNLPIDTLKIDRSFVSSIDVDGEDDPIISTIIAMGRTLDLEVVAEGVEDIGQLQVLRRQGCDIVQGYLVSAPLSATDLERFVEDSRETPMLRLSA